MSAMHERHDFALRAVHEWSSALPALEATPDQLSAAIRLSRLSNLQDRLDERTLRQFDDDGIRGSDDFRSLAILRRGPDIGVTNSQLLDQLGGSKGGMSARLDRFTHHGITQRVPSEVDRRSHTNALTAEGRELADRVVTAVVEARRQMFADLSDEQIHSFSELLALIIETVDPDD